MNVISNLPNNEFSKAGKPPVAKTATKAVMDRRPNAANLVFI
jgi:hypothetical protein